MITYNESTETFNLIPIKMKKIVLALSAILVLVSCAQTKQWTDKERTEVKEVVRAHKEKTMLKHMEDNNFANIENCVVTTVEGTYPDYNKYDKLTGKTDTLTSVMINCTTEMLGANYENLPLVFPYPQLQSIGILPADLTPDQISAFYTCFTGKVKEVSGGGILIECKRGLQAINLEYVTRLREYPTNKKGKKASVILD